MKQTITVPVTFDAASRRKDKSVSMRFTSNLEVSNHDFAEMDRLMSSEGWLLFSPNQFSEADIPKEQAPTEGKTPSQRLRAVHYVAWQSLTDKSVPFEEWHDARIEKYIQKIKDSLPERDK